MVNVKQLLKQAQTMQKKMQDMQDEFSKKEFEGKAGGGIVTMKMTGNGEMKKVSIDESLLKTEEKEMLEDLIVAAHNEAKKKADKESQENMSGTLGGMGGLPPGMNLPF